MEIVVTARHTEVAERFRRHAEEKLAKVGQLAPRAHRVDVEVSHEPNKRQADQSERVELTVRDKGPVVRAEACAGDVYSALDLAHAKLLERLRRVRDRRKVHHGRHRPTAVHEATASLGDVAADGAGEVGRGDLGGGAGTSPEPSAPGDGAEETSAGPLQAIGDCPVVIREKTHAARPMSLEDALYEMELVGHDFYLFVDKADHRPSVVYRRRGWDYGVIRLDTGAAAGGTADQERAGTTTAASAQQAAARAG